MKRSLRFCSLVISVLILVFSIGGCATTDTSPRKNPEESLKQSDVQGKFPFTLVTKDDMNVTFTKVPERVLSTNVNTGEQLMALGLESKIIGTCNNNSSVAPEYKSKYEAIPVVSEKAPSLEAVLALEPDFVYGRSSAFSEKAIGSHDVLTSHNIPSLSSIEGYKLGADIEDVYQDFINLGRIFDVEDKANELISKMKAKIEHVESIVKDSTKVRVFVYDCGRESGAYTPGNNFTSKLIRHAGGVNIFENLEKTWNTVSWEAIVESNPEIIIINDYGETSLEDKIKDLKTNPALSNISAIKNNRIISVTLPEVFASSRSAETIEIFAKAFHPELFN